MSQARSLNEGRIQPDDPAPEPAPKVLIIRDPDQETEVYADTEVDWYVMDLGGDFDIANLTPHDDLEHETAIDWARNWYQTALTLPEPLQERALAVVDRVLGALELGREDLEGEPDA